MKKKRIGIDARLWNQTGIGVYIQNLLHHLHTSYTDRYEYRVFVLQEDRELVSSLFPSFTVIPTDTYWHSLREQIVYFYQLHSHNLDLMHFTYYSYPVLYNRPFIATIHDLTPLQFRTGKASTHNKVIYSVKYMCLRYVLMQQIKNARYIITPTKTIQKQIEEMFPSYGGNKITTLYHGVHLNLREAKENTSLQTVFKPYSFFLYVGNLYPHKNVDALVTALKRVHSRIKLVICTRDDAFADRLKYQVRKNQQESQVLFYHNATDSDLVYLYKNAVALVHPSLSEGLGLPLIEAAYFHLPIIASDIPVFREVMGEDYVRFNPKDGEDIAKKIRIFSQEDSDRKIPQLKDEYSFSHMTDRITKLYQQILLDEKS